MIARLPSSLGDPFEEKDSFCQRRNIYAHQIHISGLAEVDQSFRQYLTELCLEADKKAS